MKEKELVIKIPEDIYKDIMAHNREMREGGKSAYYFEGLIKNGTPLPENHGRLGDLDALEEEMSGGINAGLMIDGYEGYSHINNTEDCLECVKYADTLINANHSTPVLDWHVGKRKSKDRDDDLER